MSKNDSFEANFSLRQVPMLRELIVYLCAVSNDTLREDYDGTWYITSFI